MKRLGLRARCSRPCRVWGVRKGRQGSRMGRTLALAGASSKLYPRLANFQPRVRRHGGTFAHEAPHHRVRRGRIAGVGEGAVSGDPTEE